jgi:hypothetical protein
MYKELNGIHTKGLIDRTQTSRDLFDAIADKWYGGENYIPKFNNSLLLQSDDYKSVHPKLKKLIGVYEVQKKHCNEINKYRHMFCDDLFRNFTHFKVPYKCETIEFIKEHLQSQEDMTDEYIATQSYAFRNSIMDMVHNKIEKKVLELFKTYDETTHTVMDEHNRKTKVFKAIKSIVKKHFAPERYKEFNEKFESLDSTKYYNSYTGTKKKTYLVITNSYASILGMSSYSEGNQWRSCQQFDAYAHDYAYCMFPALSDAGSLIAYVTNGETEKFVGLDNFEHQNMICRTTIRLLSQTDRSKMYVALDRLYPNDAYADSIYKLVYDLAKANDIGFCVHKNANYTSNQTFDNKNRFLTTKEKKSIVMFNKCPITAIKIDGEPDCDGCDYYEYQCCSKDCGGHGGCDRRYRACYRCNDFDFEVCRNRYECHECHLRPTNCVGIKIQTHYDDQNQKYLDPPIINLDTMQYKYTYRVYTEDYLSTKFFKGEE